MVRGLSTHSGEIVDMYEAGITDLSVIAEQVGITRGQAAAILRKAGYTDIYAGHLSLIDRYTDQELEEMLGDYYEGDMPIYELCHKWGISDNAAFYNIIRRLGRKPRRLVVDGRRAGRLAAIDHAVELYDTTNETIHDISVETGVNPSMINMEVKKRGLVLRRDRNKYEKTE